MSDNTPTGDNDTPPYSPPAAPTYGAPQTPPAPAYESAPQAPAYPGYTAAPAPGYAAAPGQAYAPVAPTNSLAVVALISGIAGLVIIPFIGSIVAIITGHMSLGKLKTSGEQGRGMALAGLIMGYVGIAFAALGIILLIIFIPLLATYSTYPY